MKNLVKRAAAFLAAAMVIMTVSISASADATARPRPNSSSTTTTTSQSSSDSSADDEEDSASSSNSDSNSSQSSNTASSSSTSIVSPTDVPVTNNTQSASTANAHYTTRGGAFLWFLLSIIVNTIISFAIANRFYKLTKKSNHVQSEIRALRRDIEEKFADSVGGFTEPAVDITNTNDDYSNSPDGIKMTPPSAVSTDDGPEDVYKEWEAQFAARRAERRAAIKTVRSEEAEDELDEDELDVEDTRAVRPSKKKYQPTRRGKNERPSVRERYEQRKLNEQQDEGMDDEIEDIDDGESMIHKMGSVGSKAKKFLDGIFPLDDDD